MLQLQVAVVSARPNGTTRSYPGVLQYLTSDGRLEEVFRQLVEIELTGSLSRNGRDGGGDGNIVGTKTTRHDVGLPPL